MRILLAALLLLGACSAEEAKEKAKAAYDASAAAAGKAADATSELAGKAADTAKGLASDAKEVAQFVASDAKDAASGAADAAKGAADAALGLAKDTASAADQTAALMAQKLAALTALREELGKIYKSGYDVDLLLEGVDPAAEKDFAAKLAAMPNLEVAGVTVGYEENSNLSLNGKTYTKSFRASWVYQGKKLSLAYYSSEQFDAKAFAALLEKAVPVVQGFVK